jgi:hypothetical protein
MRLLFTSATKIFPDGSIAIDLGKEKLAAVPVPSADVKEPLPANVVTW